MQARRQVLTFFFVVAVATACGGCQRLEPYRQGVLTNYHQEMRQLAEDVNRKELTSIAKTEDDSQLSQEPADSVTQAHHWDSAPLVKAVRLNPPVPFDAGQQ